MWLNSIPSQMWRVDEPEKIEYRVAGVQLFEVDILSIAQCEDISVSL